MFKVCKTLIAILTAFLLIATSLIVYAHNIESSEIKTESNTGFVMLNVDIIIPDDFSTIQQGINNANPGDTIFVKTGVYKEHLTIDKTGIILQGEDKYNTIIDGCKTVDDGIKIKAEDVIVRNFTIKNYKNQQKEDIYSWNQAGIEIHGSNVTIIDNRFFDNGVGLELLSWVHNTTIANNVMINDGLLIGNYFDQSQSDFPEITPSSFLHNIYNNTVNGKPLYYFKDKKDFTVPTDAGQITMVNCTNFTIKNIYMSNNDFSIILAYCSNSLIENLTITDTNGEFLLFACENNTIQHNIITNSLKAICLEYKSKNNIIRYNDLSKNYVGVSLFNNANNNTIYQNKIYGNHGRLGAGIEIVTYHGGTQKDNNISENQIYDNPIGIRFRENTIKNHIYKNNITKNKIGIYLESESNFNEITYNNFRKNLIQATFNGCSTNTWNNNYWNRPRFLSKPIIGLKNFGKIKIPWLNFDKSSALKPYEI